MSAALKALEDARIHMMEIFTLYRIWIGANFTDYEIEDLFRSNLHSRKTKKAFAYLASLQVTNLTESQAVSVLEIMHTYLKTECTMQDILIFFRYTPKWQRKIRKPLIQRAWSKFTRACKSCGNVLCVHKAQGLCRYCYHKVWVERREKE